MSVLKQVEAIRAGIEPALVCKVPSGWVVLCSMQYLRGYCILLPDPVAPSLNDLTQQQRAAYLCDMSTIGDALMDVTDAYRINYCILGNSDPVLHAHIVPRYLTEPDQFRMSAPWSYPKNTMDSTLFDYDRDKDLMLKIGDAIRKRM